MPTRTDEERKIIDSLEVREADKYCNARVVRYGNDGKPFGKYCGMAAGHGTDHLGLGRCKLHGGASHGAPIVHGLYAKSLNSTLSDEIERISKDPNFLNLYEEFAVTKAMFSDLLKNVSEMMEEINPDGSKNNVWIGHKQTAHGVERVISPEARLLTNMMETISRSMERIVAAETRIQNTLTIRSVQVILQQIKNNINDYCGVCPVRVHLKRGLDTIKIPMNRDGENS